jgi:hypothetical protein
VVRGFVQGANGVFGGAFCAVGSPSGVPRPERCDQGFAALFPVVRLLFARLGDPGHYESVVALSVAFGQAAAALAIMAAATVVVAPAASAASPVSLASRPCSGNEYETRPVV